MTGSPAGPSHNDTKSTAYLRLAPRQRQPEVTTAKQIRRLAMFQVRFHGRGGQGVVTAAELLASAAFREDRYAQAFPSFGSERMGAPVMSFCRIDDKPIRTHEPVTEPDALIIQDPTLLHQADLFAGLGPDGYVLINSTRDFRELGLAEFAARYRKDRLLAVPATSLALIHLGRPLPGAAMLGGCAALTGAVGLDAVLAAIRERFTGKVAAGNAAATRAAFDFVANERKTVTNA
jgi:pyruvate ferredoxin oxidoreductase gamma subunit